MLIEMFEYSVISQFGDPVAGGLTWDDVRDMSDVLDLPPSALTISSGCSDRDKVVTVTLEDPSDVDLLLTWGTVRVMARAFEEELMREVQTVRSEETTRDLLLEPPLPDNVRPFRPRKPATSA